MNPDQMIDYALGSIEDSERHRIDQLLKVNLEQRARMDQLDRAVQLLLDDGLDFEPPADLSRRTVALVAEARAKPRSIFDFVPVRVPFRWADVAVAATIFIAGLLTLLPALQRSRERMTEASCVFNLQQLAHSLAQYASLNPSYPYPPSHRNEAHTGTFAACLQDAGCLHGVSLLHCAHSSNHAGHEHQLPSFEELDKIRRTDFARYQKILCWDYAYNVGYRHPTGDNGPLESRPEPYILPVLADKPPVDGFGTVLTGNSPNHGRRGQNVLMTNGAVIFLHGRSLGSDNDIYLNKHQRPEPGVSRDDAVLLPSNHKFLGSQSR